MHYLFKSCIVDYYVLGECHAGTTMITRERPDSRLIAGVERIAECGKTHRATSNIDHIGDSGIV
ncbi:MAG: hypothetical protein EBW98_05645 [Actinobacteria bacterium]|nr:hypothetical protein [Actinomycetota bacterium]